MDAMGFLAWIVVGGLAGWLASLVTRSFMGLLGDIVVGIVGGLIGGFIFHAIGEPGLTGFSIWSVFVAFVGAVVLLFILRVVNGRSVTV